MKQANNYSGKKELLLDYQADKDLANRAFPGTWIHVVVYGIILLFTPYLQNSPTFTVVLGVVIIINSLLRTYFALAFDYWYQRNRKIWYWGYFASTLGFALIWGLFCFHAVYSYQLDWAAMLVLLSVAGVAAGSVTTLSIRLPLIIAYLTIMLIPILISTALIATKQSYAVLLVFFSSYIFLTSIAKRLSREYWAAIRNAMLLDKRARELQALNEELESFAYSASHDLRSPLRIIDGFSYLLLEDIGDQLTDKSREHFDKIRRSSQKMGQLIDDILRLSRVSRASLKQQVVNLSELAQTAVDKCRQLEQDRNVAITIQQDLCAKGDPVLLGLVMDNLIGNAWKYTGTNTNAAIEFGCHDQESSRTYFVKDNGVGFDMQYENKLFSTFHRLHKDSEFPGTGVGLAIAQRILHRHHGRIWAEAEVNKGATFYFTIGSEPE